MIFLAASDLVMMRDFPLENTQQFQQGPEPMITQIEKPQLAVEMPQQSVPEQMAPEVTQATVQKVPEVALESAPSYPEAQITMKCLQKEISPVAEKKGAVPTQEIHLPTPSPLQPKSQPEAEVQEHQQTFPAEEQAVTQSPSQIREAEEPPTQPYIPRIFKLTNGSWSIPKSKVFEMDKLSKVMKLNGKPINVLTVLALKKELDKRNLPKHCSKTGKKHDLVFRLTNYLQQNPHECDPDGPDGRPNTAGGCSQKGKHTWKKGIHTWKYRCEQCNYTTNEDNFNHHNRVMHGIMIENKIEDTGTKNASHEVQEHQKTSHTEEQAVTQLPSQMRVEEETLTQKVIVKPETPKALSDQGQGSGLPKTSLDEFKSLSAKVAKMCLLKLENSDIEGRKTEFVKAEVQEPEEIHSNQRAKNGHTEKIITEMTTFSPNAMKKEVIHEKTVTNDMSDIEPSEKSAKVQNSEVNMPLKEESITYENPDGWMRYM